MNKTQLEALRKIPREVLARTYNVSKQQASDLKMALNPDYYPILTNQEYSLDDMARKTNLSKSSIANYRSALITTGFEDRKRMIRKSWISSESDKVLSYLRGRPSTYEKICEGTGKSQNQVYSIIKFLKEKDKVKTVILGLGRDGGKRVYHTYDLIDGISNRAIAYLPGDEKLLAKEITKHLPEKLPTGMRRSLSSRLRWFLPKKTLDVVKEYMKEHAVKQV